MKELYIAIDFDGTIVEDKYPEIGELLPNAKKVINYLNRSGHHIIINSCREGSDKERAMQFLFDNSIPFESFNENHPDLVNKFENDCRKIGADLYIDDKSVFCNGIDWQEIGAIVDAKTK